MSHHETTMRSALHRAGLIPVRQTTPDARFGERSSVAFRDPNEMSDTDLISEVTQLRFDVPHIKAQLDDDAQDGFRQGNEWRSRAKKALQAKKARLEQLETVGRTRRLIALFPEIAAKIADDQAKAARLREEETIREQAAQRRKMEAEENHKEHLRRMKEAAELKAAVKASAHKTLRDSDAANKTAAEMFVKAAYRLHSKDSCDRIWKRAREMFPGNQAWAEMDATGGGGSIK